jgi:hypothetical protein
VPTQYGVDRRYRVGQKEISGKPASEGGLFHTAQYCLRAIGTDTCVWLIRDYNYHTPFKNVQRAQPVAQTSKEVPEQNTPAIDIDKQAIDSLAALSTVLEDILEGITDPASARAALPELEEAAAEIDKVNALSVSCRRSNGRLSPHRSPR